MAAPVPVRGGLGGAGNGGEGGPATAATTTAVDPGQVDPGQVDPGQDIVAEVARILRRDVGRPTAAELAMRRLLAGNQRFTGDRASHPRQDLQRVAEVRSGQHPIAACLGCADSRVPPEIVFDQGIGDLFNLRVAGNIIDDSVLGSIEYAAEHLHVPLLLVLGHGSCGAVTAAIESHRTGQVPQGYVAALVEGILPAIEPVLNGMDPATPADVVVRECAIANVAWVMGQVRSRSDVIAELEAEGKVSLVGGFYDIVGAGVSLIG